MAGEVRHSPHGAQDRATMTAENECPFCDRIAMRRDLLGANSLCVAFYDTKPLNPGHVLIVPYRHEPDFLALFQRSGTRFCAWPQSCALSSTRSIGRTGSTSG